jgi:hypothetical protein
MPATTEYPVPQVPPPPAADRGFMAWLARFWEATRAQAKRLAELERRVTELEKTL